MNIIYVFIAIVVLWSIGGLLGSRIETTEYTVVENRKDYEIRLYPAHIVAQTVVKGSYKEATSQGFRIIAGYIFGGNIKKESIAMTSPVVEQISKSESIAMTSPVMATIEGESHTIAFGMPR